MLSLLPALFAALLPQRPDALSSRRAAIQGAAALTLPLVASAPLLTSPGIASAVDSDAAEIGFNGGLRSDIGPSIMGSGVEVLITDQSYTELSACPKGFFVPAKGGPWTCLEISVTATNNVCPPRHAPRASV